jgi:prepilin-type N-terminal cleavage/methylation domain-containing protein
VVPSRGITAGISFARGRPRVGRCARPGNVPPRRHPSRLGDERGVTLIEMLVAASIGVLLSTMLVGVWVALSGSYAYSSRSEKSRDLARQALSRLAREIRDAEALPGHDVIRSATPSEIRFTTTFNEEGNTSDIEPVLTRYWLDTTDGTLHRQRDSDGDGLFLHGSQVDPDDRQEIVVRHVMNGRESPGTAPAGIFGYTWLDVVGQSVSAGPDAAPGSDFAGELIVGVDIGLVLDLNPGKAPEPARFATVVDLRNQQL